MVASPETISQVVSNYQRAADANRHVSTRQGNVICLSPSAADEVMITADLHGNRLNFRRLLHIADLEAKPRRHLIMQEVCHGGPTYPRGGGCMSHLLLEDMAHCKTAHPEQFHFILGNHELAELTDFPISKSNRLLNLMFRRGLEEMYAADAPRVRDAMSEFLRSCPLAVRMSNGIFISHSAPKLTEGDNFDVTIFDRPLRENDWQAHGAVFRLLWGRDYRAENAEAFSRLVNADLLIHGHEPCPNGFCVPNDRQIILDCCSQRACYLILPTQEKLTHQQIVANVLRLN
jgi:hypothetical protein